MTDIITFIKRLDSKIVLLHRYQILRFMNKTAHIPLSSINPFSTDNTLVLPSSNYQNNLEALYK